jgi:ankyrin repeat protein
MKHLLNQAIQDGDTAALKIFLELGAHPDYPDENGVFPLAAAIQSDNKKAQEILLKYGANPNLKNIIGMPVLVLACFYDRDISCLLAYGAETNTKSLEGITPLMCSILRANVSNTAQLLKAGAKVSPMELNFAQNRGGKAPEDSPKFQIYKMVALASDNQTILNMKRVENLSSVNSYSYDFSMKSPFF